MRLVSVVYLHTFILSLGAVLSALGSWFAASHKKEFLDNDNDTHLYSLHSWLGMSGYVFMAFCVQLNNTNYKYYLCHYVLSTVSSHLIFTVCHWNFIDVLPQQYSERSSFPYIHFGLHVMLRSSNRRIF